MEHLVRAYVARKEFEAKVMLAQYAQAMGGGDSKREDTASDLQLAQMGIGIEGL